MNSFELLFLFASKLRKVTKIYTDNMAIQLSLDTYKEFIKNFTANKREREILI